MAHRSNFYKIKIAGLTLILSIMVIITGCAIIPKEEEIIAPPVVKPKPPKYNLYEVKKGSIAKTVKGMGSFKSSKEWSLFYKIDGRLAEINVNIGAQVKKGDVLISLEASDLENAIKQQEYALEKVRLTISYWENMEAKIQNQVPDADTSEQKYQINMSRVDEKSIKYNLSKLKEQLNNTRLVAPIDGRVVFVAEVSEGDMIHPYQNLVKIADPEHLQLVMEYKTDSSTPVTVGMKAEIEINKELYEGEVEGTPDTFPEDTDERYKNVLVLSVKNKPEDVQIGDMAGVTIITQKKDNVLIIPKQAIREYMGRKYVQILDDNIKKEIDIEIGIESATEVEVLKGLKQGHQVILR